MARSTKKRGSELGPGEFAKADWTLSDIRANPSIRTADGRDGVRSARVRVDRLVAHVDTWPGVTVRFGGGNFTYPENLFAIGALTRGRATYTTIDGSVLRQEAGQGVFIPGGEDLIAEFEAGTTTAGFLVPIEAMPKLALSLPRSPFLLTRPSVSVDALHSLASAIVAQEASIPHRQQELIARSVDALLMAISVENPPFQAIPNSRFLIRMRVDAYIASHFADPNLSIDTIAETFHLARRTLQRAYEGTDTTVWQAVNQLRAKHAISLLTQNLSPALSLDTVATLSGFSSRHHMDRAVRDFTGHSPSALRSAARNQTAERSAPTPKPSISGRGR